MSLVLVGGGGAVWAFDRAGLWVVCLVVRKGLGLV